MRRFLRNGRNMVARIFSSCRGFVLSVKVNYTGLSRVRSGYGSNMGSIMVAGVFSIFIIFHSCCLQ